MKQNEETKKFNSITKFPLKLPVDSTISKDSNHVDCHWQLCTFVSQYKFALFAILNFFKIFQAACK